MRACDDCGKPLGPRARRYCADCRDARSPFGGGAPYGTYTGRSGDPDDWAHAFHERFTLDQIHELLGSRTAWEILGVDPGASMDAIRRAYRAQALATHPDHHPELGSRPFQEVQAAYEELRGR